jgi:hypothetical protein
VAEWISDVDLKEEEEHVIRVLTSFSHSFFFYLNVVVVEQVGEVDLGRRKGTWYPGSNPTELFFF